MNHGDRVVIELQRVKVRPDVRNRYLEKDAEIWTAGLESEPGFLGKEVWLGEDGEVVLLIRWRSREDWQGIPPERLEELERRFRREIPNEAHEVIECRAYDVVGK